MSTEEKKQVLMHLIEEADEKLTGLLIALADEYNSSGQKYTEDEIKDFYAIRDHLIAHPESGYTPEQAFAIIKNKNKNAV